jgi:hypothetical protein
MGFEPCVITWPLAENSVRAWNRIETLGGKVRCASSGGRLVRRTFQPDSARPACMEPGDEMAGVPFGYSANRKSAGVHKDTWPPSVLCEGRSSDPVHGSVQYDEKDVSRVTSDRQARCFADPSQGE